MRIEINLPDNIAKAIQEKAAAQSRSRKKYIELLCIQDSGQPAAEAQIEQQTTNNQPLRYYTPRQNPNKARWDKLKENQ